MKKIESVDVICNVTHVGGWIGAKSKDEGILKSARALEKEIERHCDYSEGSSIKINFVCSYCDSVWEDNPQCCNEVIDEFKRTKGEVSA